MTERPRGALARSERQLQIGRSFMRWEDGVLSASIDEITVPIPQRLRGTIKLSPQSIQTQQFALDAAGRHRWQPIAPRARIEVNFEKPKLSWQGTAYFDTNDGDAPLSRDFKNWHWSRSHRGANSRVLYHVHRRDGSAHEISLRIDRDGNALAVTPPPLQPLPKTLWRLPRQTYADIGHNPTVIKNFEDAPFYSRALIATYVDGLPVQAVYESLDLDRFDKNWVKCLLPFRMPRL
ncbi:MAG TPA: carotenoid 1,2-hydratase [Acidocella sp.]|nr:carotenoid 1,2-hydratase [Acidocella sp.]HQU05353.1 carotenoid 1,2-hydratase [Acidocella sp.]